MMGADPGWRGPLWGEFTRAQGGQAISHLARAFHVPRPKAKAAVLSMLSALTQHFDEQTLSRGKLARLIELLGKNDYEQVLETPALMGATHTQVIGNDALTALAGRDESSRIASRAATASGISEMIAEYLLPVVAAMFMGALAAKTRTGLSVLMRNGDAPGAEPSPEPSTPALQFPIGRGSSGFFAGTAVGSAVGANPAREAMYLEFAERIRLGEKSGNPDPLGATRRVMAEGLGVRARHAPWFARVQKWGTDALRTAGLQTQERLRALRSRRRDND